MKATVCAGWILAVAMATSLASARPQSGGNAMYTSIQADRGKTVYEQSCGACHGASLRGGANEFAAPALAGPFFFEKWGGRALEELYRYAADNMPPNGRLAAEVYVDLTAYILQVLKYPAGPAELRVDSALMKRPIQPQQ